MRSTIALLVILSVIAGVAAGPTGADGSPYSPGLSYGWPGVGARKAGVNFVAFGMPKSTIVAAVRVRDGRVLRSSVLRGFYGIPLVAFDGTSGGLSADRTSLVLASDSPYPGLAGRTRFVVLRTGSLSVSRRLVLPGSWSFDAVSPDAALLYLTEHLRGGDEPLYRVRTYDLRTRRLGDALVDRLEGEDEMGGVPVARASSSDGRWAYTLYARRHAGPFVHALDTAERQTFCIDLPLKLDAGKQWSLQMKLGSVGATLSVRLGGRELATVDTRTWAVRTKSG